MYLSVPGIYHGTLCLSVPGILTLTDRLITPVESVGDAFVSVTLSEPLLSSVQVQKLNPLVIHIHSATKLPASPVPFSSLVHR